MMPIATISLVTADQLSCRLAAADDHAWPEYTSTARNDHSFVCGSPPIAPIYESEFLGFSYGFRPKRNQHPALDATPAVLPSVDGKNQHPELILRRSIPRLRPPL